MITRVSGFALFLNVVLLAAPSFAQGDSALFDMPFESLLKIEIETPSKYEETLFEAPSVISVISKKDIETYGAISLRDLVGRLPGLMLLTDGDIQNDDVGIRGASVNLRNHLLLLINGRPFRSVPAGSDSIRRLLNTFPLDLIEQIEFIRGPGSALYSTGAYTAILNIVTVDGQENLKRVTVGTGSDNASFVSASYSYVSEESAENNLVLNVSGWQDDGWTAEFNDVTASPAAIEIGEDYRNITVFGNYNGFHAGIYAGNRDSNNFGQRSPFDPTTIKDAHKYGVLGYTYELDSKTTLEGNLSWLHTNVNTGRFKDDEYLLELDLTKTLSKQLKMLLGINTLKTEFESKSPIIGDYDIDTTQLYVQFDYRVSEDTNLFVGGQANRTEQQKYDYVPRLGLVHQFSRKWGAKLLYNEAYRNPNAVETGLALPPPPIGVIGDNSVKPETARTTELELFHHTESHYASLTLFHTEQDDLIDPVLDAGLGVLRYSNANEREIQGAEFVFSKKYPDQGLSFDGSISYQENTDTTDSDIEDITTLPRTLVKLGVGYHGDTLSFGIWNTHVSSFRTNEVYEASKLFVNPQAESYNYMTGNVTWHARTFRGLGDDVSLTLKLFVQNVLDEDILQNTLQQSTPLNTFPSETDRAVYLSAVLDY